MSLIMLAEKRETSPLILVYFCSSWKRPSPCFHYVSTTVAVFIRQSSQNIHTLQGRQRLFVGDSAFHTYFGRAPLLVGDTAEVVSPSATSTESLIPYHYTPYTACTLVVYINLYWYNYSQYVPILFSETTSARSCSPPLP